MKKGRKVSGGKYHKPRKKKVHEMPGNRRLVRLGKDKKKTQRTTGGNLKTVIFKTSFVNVNTKGKVKKTEIKNVLETPSHRFLARQNIITKGTIVETDIGKVRITNRPSQEGTVNGILVS